MAKKEFKGEIRAKSNNVAVIVDIKVVDSDYVTGCNWSKEHINHIQSAIFDKLRIKGYELKEIKVK